MRLPRGCGFWERGRHLAPDAPGKGTRSVRPDYRTADGPPLSGPFRRLSGPLARYSTSNRACEYEGAALVDLMSLAEQVNSEFGQVPGPSAGSPEGPEWSARSGHATAVRREAPVITTSSTTGSWRTGAFAGAVEADRARLRLRRGVPPMSLYWLDEVYFFVQDNHHAVSVAHFRGTEWMDAKVTEFRSTVCGIPLQRVKSVSVSHSRARILPRSGSGHRQHLVGAAQ